MSFIEFIQVKRDIAQLTPVFVGQIGGISISNSTLYGLLLVLLVALLVVIARKFSAQTSTPSSTQIAFELFYESAYGLVRQIAGSNTITNIIFPVTGALFVFILLSNLLGTIPGIGAITINGVSMFRTTTGDSNTTIPLAVMSVILIHAYTIRYKGLMSIFNNVLHVGEIRDALRRGIRGIGDLVMALFLALLDVVGEFAKVLSMSLRLFGNMFAGDVLMTILLGIISIGIPALWLGMSLLSAVVQAIVFTSLVSIFFSLNLSGISREET
jgi:F-type H+-transporting ATPase subunit a